MAIKKIFCFIDSDLPRSLFDFCYQALKRHFFAVKNLFAVFALLCTFAVFADGNPERGKEKSATCIGCHGVDGNSIVPSFPKLAGQGEGYLLKQLADFKSSGRKDSTMNSFVMVLSEEDMADISAYYAHQRTSPGVVSDPAVVALGEKLYRSGNKNSEITACIACHGPNGEGIPSAKFPALASQHALYTAKQLTSFRQVALNRQISAKDPLPERTNDYESIMRIVAKNLTDKEISALSQYIAGLSAQ